MSKFHLSLKTGSLAAVTQAGIGSVAAGSAFAIIQSLTMAGTISLIGSAMVGLAVAIPAVMHLWRGWMDGNQL